MDNFRHMLPYFHGFTGFTKVMRSFLLPFCLLAFAFPAWAQTCPDLSSFYIEESSSSPEGQVEAAQTLERQLAAVISQCLESSEFFALYGAAQMDSGKLADALESLERALLLDASNGAAQIDYAQALYLRGQLFSALDLNDQILRRGDIPADLRDALTQRRQEWRQQTRRTGLQADVLAGYDNNLNGAPDPGQITLTLSGVPVILTLNPEYRPISGPYLNLRLAGNYQQIASDHQHNALVELRGRVSEDSPSDLLQLQTRYAYVRPSREHTWQFNAAMGHLFFGGNALYTATDIGARYRAVVGLGCTSNSELASQHQLYHGQNNLNSLESKLSAGVECPLQVGGRTSLAGIEFSLLNNTALNDNRPGGDRNGWQMNVDWQFPLLRGIFTAQLNHTQLQDTEGYSELLAGGAERWLRRSYVLFQYRQPIALDMALLVNLYQQHQSSNIELFESTDRTLEIGISMAF